MIIYYESMHGPVKCEVVQELCRDFVVVRPKALPSGVFGSFGSFGTNAARMREFTALKSMCWSRARALDSYGCRHEFSGRPQWAIPASIASSVSTNPPNTRNLIQ